MRVPILSLRTAVTLGFWTVVALGTRADALRGQGASASIVQGTVIEAQNGGAVAGATVDLRAKGADWHHSDRTDERGRYHFTGVKAGEYELRVRAVGFQPRALQVSLGAASQSISFVVEPSAVSLAPVIVVRQAPDVFARLSARDASRNVAGDLHRGMAFMSLDARAIDYDEITRTITPGEPDLMRTLLRHPAVESRDDYSTALWIRGAPWDESLVTFDGVPLFNPLHAAGAVAAINLDGLGGVSFLPTPLSTEHVGSASGHVALNSRRGTSDSTTAHVLSGLSVFSGSAALDGARSDGRADWMIAARRSHIDLVTAAAARMTGSVTGVPYDFSDIIARGGVEFAQGWRAEASALEEGDRLQAPIPGIVDGGSGHWGGFARRVSVTGQRPNGTLQLGAMWSGFASTLDITRGGPTLDTLLTIADNVLFAVRETLYKPQPLSNVVGFKALTAAWRLQDAERGGVGAQITEQTASDSTSGSWPHSTEVMRSTNIGGTLRYLALWGDRSWTPAEGVDVRGGIRVETGGRPGGSAVPRVAPSASLRWKPDISTAFSISGARTFQYAQTLAPSGPGRNAVATSGAFWVVAGDTVPMACTDMLTIASEQRFGSSTSATITAYARKTTGAVVTEPHPGELIGRPLFIRGVREAHGVELSARYFGERFLGSTSLALGKSTIDAAGLRYAAPEERRAAFRADGTFRLINGVRAMLAYSHVDGVPFTRYHEGTVMAFSSGAFAWRTPPRIEEPSGARSDPYRSIDMGLEGSGHWGARDITMYVQMRNITGTHNDAAYLNSVGQCAPSVANCTPEFSSTYVDTRLTPLRFFPAAGVRIAF